MPATFEWDEHNGAGASPTHNITQINWMSVDQPGTTANATLYIDNPITATQNSFDKYVFGHFSGSWNNLSDGKFAHTGGPFGTGIELWGQPGMTSGTGLAYVQPSQTTNAALTNNMTSTTTIDLGVNVYFGITSPSAGGKTSSINSVTVGTTTVYTNYLVTQMRTAANAAAGNTATAVLTFRYNEN